MPALSASSSRRISSATAEKTSAGSIPRATRVATRRSAACSLSRRASSSRLVSSAARFCAFATAVATRSVNSRHPLLGVRRQRPLPGPHGDRSPQPAVDVDRQGDRGPQPLAEIRLPARDVTIVIDPGGLAGPPDGRGQPGRRVALPAFPDPHVGARRALVRQERRRSVAARTGSSGRCRRRNTAAPPWSWPRTPPRAVRPARPAWPAAAAPPGCPRARAVPARPGRWRSLSPQVP